MGPDLYERDIDEMMAAGCSWKDAADLADIKLINRGLAMYHNLQNERQAERDARKNWLSRFGRYLKGLIP